MTKQAYSVSKRNVAYSANEIRKTQRYKDIVASGTYSRITRHFAERTNDACNVYMVLI